MARVDGDRRDPTEHKGVGASVIGSTINMNSSLRVRATKVGADSALAQIVAPMQSAQNSQALVQKLADQAAFWLVFVAFAGTTGSEGSWPRRVPLRLSRHRRDRYRRQRVHQHARIADTCPSNRTCRDAHPRATRGLPLTLSHRQGRTVLDSTRWPGLYVPFHEAVISLFAGYEVLKPIDLDAFAPATGTSGASISFWRPTPRATPCVATSSPSGPTPSCSSTCSH